MHVRIDHFVWISLIVSCMGACTGTRPTDLGVMDGKLKPCPDKPNCVVSQSPSQDHNIEPIGTDLAPEASMARIEAIVKELPRTHVVEKSPQYLRVEFTSLIFRFVDDVEFYQAPGATAVQVRSASRLGHSDMGANRDRIEDLRSRFSAKL